MRALSLDWQTGAKTKNKVNERLGAERPLDDWFDYSLALASWARGRHCLHGAGVIRAQYSACAPFIAIARQFS